MILPKDSGGVKERRYRYLSTSGKSYEIVSDELWIGVLLMSIQASEQAETWMPRQ